MIKNYYPHNNVLMVCNDYAYLQYFALLFSRYHPRAIFKMARNINLDFIPNSELKFDHIILDAEKSDDLKIFFRNEMVRNFPKNIYVFYKSEICIKESHSANHIFIRHPQMHNEIIEFLNNNIK